MKGLARVPWPVWVALLPAALIGINELRKGGRLRVDVVGAGPVARLAEVPPPKGMRFVLGVEPREPPSATLARLERVIRVRRELLVVGLDAEGQAEAALRDALVRAARLVRHGAKVGLLVGPTVTGTVSAAEREALDRVDAWWRREVCREDRRLRCVTLRDTRGDPEAIRLALHAAIADAVRHLDDLRVETQRRR